MSTAAASHSTTSRSTTRRSPRTSSPGLRSRRTSRRSSRSGTSSRARDVLNPMPFSTGLSFTDTVWQDCTGPYENTGPPDGGNNPEQGDAPCYPKGFTHHGHAPPNQVSGCAPVLHAERRPRLRRDVVLARLAGPADARPVPVAVPAAAADDRREPVRADPVPVQRTGQRGELPADRAGLRSPAAGRPRALLSVLDAGAGERALRLGVRADAQRPVVRGHRQYGGPSAYFFGNLEGPIMANPSCG